MSIPVFYGMAQNSGAAYQIDNSIRLRASASAYLSRTFGAGSTTQWTISVWVKLGDLTKHQTILNGGNGTQTNGTNDAIQIYPDGGVALQRKSGVGGNWYRIFSSVIRDPSGWYHFVLRSDLGNGTVANRLMCWINGVQQNSYTDSSTVPNGTWPYLSAAVPHNIGRSDQGGGPLCSDQYLAEYCFIDANATLTPSDFGETNTNGVWVPKAYSGTYGNNGFYLPFDDATSLTTLGYDRSGNSNNWTCNNISLSTGVTYDHMVDTPTNNYATLNPLDESASAGVSNANLTTTGTNAGWVVRGSVAMTSGKWYWEQTQDFGGAAGWCGIASDTASLSSQPAFDSQQWAYYGGSGNKYNGAANSAYGVTWTNGDVIGVALDMDAGTLAFYKNGVSQGVAYSTGIVGKTFFAAVSFGSAVSYSETLNFGQRPFSYTPPTGFKALCTANLSLTAPTASGTFTGNASADGPFVWIGGVPTTLTINGNAVTFGTHADKAAGGFKLRTSSSSYNAAGSNSWTATFASPSTKSAFAQPQPAQGNP